MVLELYRVCFDELCENIVGVRFFEPQSLFKTDPVHLTRLKIYSDWQYCYCFYYDCVIIFILNYPPEGCHESKQVYLLNYCYINLQPLSANSFCCAAELSVMHM